jgi:di/tricarboxylate transporter
LFDGFSSNAVISIIAVMILGAGLDKTGIMSRVAASILKYGGSTEQRIIPLVSGTVGVISSFMQNVGAAALFLPVVSRISSRTGLPMSRLLMPMGFCAILGGTVTLIGSSPLILLNDLIVNSNQALPEDKQMETFSLFAVTPVGLALLATGIVYFVLAGRFVLPRGKTTDSGSSSTAQYFKRVYGIDAAINEVAIPLESPIIGKPIGEVEREDRVRIIATNFQGTSRISPPRDVTMDAPAVLAVLGPIERVRALAEKYGLKISDSLETFSEMLIHTNAGICEIVIPPNSDHIGKSTRDLWLRKTYGLSVLAIHRGEETITEGVREVPFQAGDTLVCHNSWAALARVNQDRNFVVVTSEYPREDLRPQKSAAAVVFFVIALGLVLFTDLRLSIALLTGALGMVVSRVLTMDEAYEAVSWKTVFLLACLIPLGQAVENTGTAEWIAQQTLAILGDVPNWSLQAAIAVLASFFTLVMSNVGATVLLVPLAVNIALASGADPAVFAITVAIATSNSFLIPTHQVNALIMGPGGYSVIDFLRAGGIMTVLFLVVSLVMLDWVF